MKAIINVTVYDFVTYKEDQYVLYDTLIRQVGPMVEFEDLAYDIIDGSDCLLLPGFVNGHTHIYSTFARGLSLPYNPKNFQDILDQLWWKIDSQLNLEACYYSGLVYAMESVQNGVTTLIDHHASGLNIIGSLDEIARGVSDTVGLRGIYCFETSDRFDVAECIAENKDFIKYHKTNKKAGLFGLHAGMSLSDKTLSEVKRHIDNQPIHIHIGESSLDQELSMRRHQCHVVERLDAYDLITPGSLLAHCLYVSDKELGIISDRKAHVVFNIASNMNNGVGLPDYQRFEQRGIPIMLGNDGISPGMTNEWQNIYYTSHLKTESPIGFSLDQLNQVIRNTYTYAGNHLGIKLGEIQEGYVSDLQLIPYIGPTKISQDNIMGHLFFGLSHQWKPKYVICDGETIIKEYEINDTHKEMKKEAVYISQKVWDRVKGSRR